MSGGGRHAIIKNHVSGHKSQTRCSIDQVKIYPLTNCFSLGAPLFLQLFLQFFFQMNVAETFSIFVSSPRGLLRTPRGLLVNPTWTSANPTWTSVKPHVDFGGDLEKNLDYFRFIWYNDSELAIIALAAP